MELNINGGYMAIDDDNHTHVSKAIADQIFNNCIEPDYEPNKETKDKGNTYRPQVNIVN